jgi:hypothetical protein
MISISVRCLSLGNQFQCKIFEAFSITHSIHNRKKTHTHKILRKDQGTKKNGSIIKRQHFYSTFSNWLSKTFQNSHKKRLEKNIWDMSAGTLIMYVKYEIHKIFNNVWICLENSLRKIRMILPKHLFSKPARQLVLYRDVKAEVSLTTLLSWIKEYQIFLFLLAHAQCVF